MKEKDLQKQIMKQIESVYSLIQNKEILAEYPVSDSYQPYFSVNYLIREKYIKYGNMILNSLKSDLQTVNGNKISNISLEKKERLYPDILLYDICRGKYLILELKRDSKSEREAVTELMGYLLEIKNHLPLSSNSDVELVIISTEFHKLLLHSVAALLLLDIPLLCLKPCVRGEEFTGFEILNLDIWTNLDNSFLSKQAFSGCTLCLYGKDSTKLPEEEVLSDLLLACELLKDDANRMKNNGFCIAWKTFRGDGVQSPAGTDYFISIFMINPYRLYYENFRKEGESDILAGHIEQTVTDMGVDASCSLDLEPIVSSATAYLKQKYMPQYEMFCNYEEFLTAVERQGIPLFCDMWGEVGRFMKQLYINPAMNFCMDKNQRDFHHPAVFFSLLDYTCNDYLFACGFDFCGDYFKFGRELSVLLCVLEQLHQTPDHAFYQNKVRFTIWKLANSFQEIYSHFHELNARICIDLQETQKSIGSLKDFLKELLQRLDEKSTEHQALRIGLTYYMFFTELIPGDSIPDEIRESFAENVFPFWCDCLMGIWYDSDGGCRMLMSVLAYFSYNLHWFDMGDTQNLSDFTQIIPKEQLRSRLKALDVSQKVELLQMFLFEVLDCVRAWPHSSEYDQYFTEQNLAELLASSDMTWILEQIEKSNQNPSGEIAYLAVHSNGSLNIERSGNEAVRCLYKQLKPGEIVVKFSMNGADIFQRADGHHILASLPYPRLL